MVTNIEFEAIVLPIKKYLFRQCMVAFVNKLELSDQKYETNGYIRYENYMENLLFSMKYFVPFGTYFWLMYFMSTKLLKDNIYGFRVPRFQLVTLATHLIINRNVWLSFVMKYIVCGG